jgi:hypothetical protein
MHCHSKSRLIRTRIETAIATFATISAELAPVLLVAVPGGGVDPVEHLGEVVPQPLPVFCRDLL